MTDDQPEPVVLGAELAAARAVEELRQPTGEASPLEGISYEVHAGSVASPRFGLTDTDHELREVFTQWADLAPGDLAELRGRLSMDDFSTIMRFAHRATAFGLRTGDADWPATALTGLTAVSTDRIDHRDLTWAAALAAFTLNRLGERATRALRAAENRADPGAAAIIGRFAESPPLALRSWGYAAIERDGGVTLMRQDRKRFEPTTDIVGKAQAIAAAIDDDEHYVCESIGIGVALPKVWLRGGAEEAAGAEALERSLAATIVRATRLCLEQPGRLSFCVWLVEFASQADTELVARGAAASIGEHNRLALTHGSLLALLISRSVDNQTPNPEDNGSIGRFKDPLRRALEK